MPPSHAKPVESTRYRNRRTNRPKCAMAAADSASAFDLAARAARSIEVGLGLARTDRADPRAVTRLEHGRRWRAIVLRPRNDRIGIGPVGQLRAIPAPEVPARSDPAANPVAIGCTAPIPVVRGSVVEPRSSTQPLHSRFANVGKSHSPADIFRFMGS